MSVMRSSEGWLLYPCNLQACSLGVVRIGLDIHGLFCNKNYARRSVGARLPLFPPSGSQKLSCGHYKGQTIMKRVALLAIVVGLGLSVVAGNLLAAVTLTTLHTFTGADGDAPVAGLALGTNGNFYGTTAFGGMETNGCVGSCGTLFEISSDGAFTSLHLFNHDDGSAPRGGLVQASDGNLYGTTFDGGACGLGTAFRITASGVLTTISPPDPGSCC